MKKITKWYKKIVTDTEVKYVFNHISDGWSHDDYPSAFKADYTNQLSWRNELWSKEFKYMNENYKIVTDLSN